MPPEMAPELGFLAGMVLGPHLVAAPGPTAELALGFAAALEAGPSSPQETVGRALAFAAAIDFAFVGRTTQAQWDAMAKRNEDTATWFEAEKDDSSLADSLRAGVQRFPLRAAMWIREHRRWRALRDEALSPEGMHLWLQRAWAENPPRV